MSTCQHCRRKTDLYLCSPCTDELHEMLESLPWLFDQLEITVHRRDKLNTGAIGKSADNPSPINVGAMELARETRDTLQRITDTLTPITGRYRPPAAVPESFIGPLLPAWRRLPAHYRPGAPELILWLLRHHQAIPRHHHAGQHYTDIQSLVGETSRPDQPGRILDAINRSDRTYYGPCTQLVGRDRHGHDRECGADLYANRESTTLTCPKCKLTVDARKQLTATITRRDLVTETRLLETMDNLDPPEHLPRAQLYEWIKAGRLTPRGYVHQGRIVAHRVRRGDPRVFSLSQARQLRWRDESVKQETG